MQYGHGLCVGSADKNLGLGSTCNTCHNEAKAAHKGVDAAAVNDCAKCHGVGTVTSMAVKPVSEWDRIRADVRGEKLPEVKPVATDPKKPRAVLCKPGDLRELLTAQLHAHAKNVRNLEKNDWVTVVVTFDELPGAKAVPTVVTANEVVFKPDELKSLTLGDLHMKQGKFKEAVEAYEKGLARYKLPMRSQYRPADGEAFADAQKVIDGCLVAIHKAHHSLAKAALELGNADKAKRALDFISDFKITMGERVPAGTEKAKPHLPAKIVLAVCKSDIDRNPKLDEFRKAMSVELVGFPLPEPAKK